MRLGWRDLAGTTLVAAIAVVYVTYLTNGSALFISDTRGMAVTALALGWAACMVAAPRFAGAGFANVLLSTGGVATLGLGIAAIVLESNTAILAAFIAAIVTMWAMTLLRHAVGSMTGGSGSTARHVRAGV